MRYTRSLVLSSIALCMATNAQAYAVFTDASVYDSTVTGATIEDFESYPVSGTGTSGALPQLILDNFTVSSNPDAVKLLDTPEFGPQNTTPGGSQYLYLDTDARNTGSQTDIFDFSGGGITSFGFMYTIHRELNRTLSVTVEGNTFDLPDVDSANMGFWGYVGDGLITSLIIDSGTLTNYGIDDFRFVMDSATPPPPPPGNGNPVPEPASIVLLGLGLAGLVFAKKKKPLAQ